ncbi:hypothetical protein CRUP_011894 [Coryphaenoides rupestris]|nr:hypothetical protein CRUP_011894 [Coryphaenoides rupestris]
MERKTAGRWSSPFVEKIKVFEEYFTSKIHLYDKDEIERQGSVLVDYADLIGNSLVGDSLPELAKELKEQPELSLNCLGLAIHQVLTTDLEKQAAELQGDELNTATPIISIPHISARLYNFEPLTPLRTLRASVFGRLDSRATSGGEEFSLKELYAIQEIQSQPDLLRLIVHSLCPAIYGHLLVKAGLSLALFGGRQKRTERNCIPIRGDPHVLVVGDPGLGKSQMLQPSLHVAQSPISWLCCIDEFDKLGSQQQALLEAMEQQSVSLAKAGIVSCLPARTSVIAAANPTGGHYNRSKTVSENLRMGSALLSRFDIVFLLLDVPEESHDRLLSEHVMATRTGRGGVPAGESVDVIPACLLRKYVSYARQYVHPTLSPEAAHTLQEFYLSLRVQAQSADSTPITTRQLDLADTYADGLGSLDFQRSQLGSGMSQRSVGKRLVNALHSHAQRTNQKLFDMQQLRSLAERLNIQLLDFEGLISSLNEQGFLLKRGAKVYQLQTI